MTIDQLACFLTVAECGSFTKAAEKLYITLSAVSKTIALMEDDLGVNLLIRNNRSVSLTPAGQLLQDRGTHVLSLFRDLEGRVRRMGNIAYGTLSLYVPYLYSPEMIPIYRMMRERYPYINIDVQSCEPMSIGTAISNQHVDAGLTFSFSLPKDCGDILSIPLLEDRFYCVCAEDHPFSGRESISTKELLTMPLVCPPTISEEMAPSALTHIIRPYQETDFQAASLEEVIFRVALGGEVAILPGSVFSGAYAGRGCSIVPLSDLEETFTLQIIWNRKKMSPSLNCFLNLVREHNHYLESLIATKA